MQGWDNLEAARADAQNLDEARFTVHHGHCVLVSLEIGSGMLAPTDDSKGPRTLRHLRVSSESYAPSVVRYTELAHHVSSVNSSWISIGRTSENDVVVNDYTVSRHHARFRNVEGAGFVIEDLESVNGTAVEGNWIETREATRIRSGDSLRFGRLIFTFMKPSDFYLFLVTLVQRP